MANNNDKLNAEIRQFIEERRSLQLATMSAEAEPYASYAPFAIGDNCFYVLLSDIALHGVNLKNNPKASVLLIEDESLSAELFARVRINYQVNADTIALDSEDWTLGVDTLAQRHGERIHHLSQLKDFQLFRLNPIRGRYVKGFGQAFAITEGVLSGSSIEHLRDGHKPRIQASDIA